MSTGQTILTLAAIVLLAIITMGIRSMYLQSVNNTVGAQHTSDALNFGRDLSERIQRHSGSTMRYELFKQEFSNCLESNYDENDIDLTVFNDNCKINNNSVAGESFVGLVTISSDDDEFDFGVAEQTGRYVTIRIFREVNEEFVFDAEYKTIVTNFLAMPQPPVGN
jgi:hypothetical protein